MTTEMTIDGNIIEFDNTMCSQDLTHITDENTINHTIDCLITEYSSKWDPHKKQYVIDEEEKCYDVYIDNSQFTTDRCTGVTVIPTGVFISPQCFMQVDFLIYAQPKCTSTILLPTYEDAFYYISKEDKNRNVPITIRNGSLKIKIQWVLDKFVWNIIDFFILPSYIEEIISSPRTQNDSHVNTNNKSSGIGSFFSNKNQDKHNNSTTFKKIKQRLSPSSRIVPPLNISGQKNPKSKLVTLSPREQVIAIKQEILENKQVISGYSTPNSLPVSPKVNFVTRLIKKRSSISHETTKFTHNMINSPSLTNFPQLEKDINEIKLASVSKELKITDIQHQLNVQSNQIRELAHSMNLLNNILVQLSQQFNLDQKKS